VEPPRWFVEAVEREFGGRLRVRWSPTRRAWQIEQKVERAKANLPDFWMQRYYTLSEGRRRDLDDRLTRARDGYVFVLEVTPGTRMPCPVCHLELRVPVMELAEVRCTYCQAAGRDVTVRAGYWPLGESLLDQLRKMDPHTGAIARAVKAADGANAAREASRTRDLSNTNEAILKDHFTQLFQIPSVGYTGREHAWDHA
jgi:hypothetical protein